MQSQHGKKWTRKETLAAFNHYFRIPFGKFHRSNLEVIRIAGLMGRSPGSVSMKLCNLASHDAKIKGKGKAGLKHASKMDAQVWEEFYANPDILVRESEQAAAALENQTVEEHALAHCLTGTADIPEGREQERVVRVRIHQSWFRRAILSDYRNRCCVTGLAVPGLLNASHIVPWSENTKNRLNPENGLCLNILHHRAFDLGMMTITPDGAIKISPSLRAAARPNSRASFIAEVHGKKIEMPRNHPPSPEFLKYHNRQIFQENLGPGGTPHLPL